MIELPCSFSGTALPAWRWKLGKTCDSTCAIWVRDPLWRGCRVTPKRTPTTDVVDNLGELGSLGSALIAANQGGGGARLSLNDILRRHTIRHTVRNTDIYPF